MAKKVVIIGASGHGKVVADIVVQSGDQVVGFLDDNSKIDSKFMGFPVLGKVKTFREYNDCWFVVAIGNAQNREKIVSQVQGVKWYTAIHPSAIISGFGVEIGEGTVVMASAVINPGASIGKHCIINTASSVDHDCIVDDYVHIAVGSHLCGNVYIGVKTWIGAGAVIRNNTQVCGGCTIGLGAVVVNSLDEVGTYIGIPARLMTK